MKNKRIIVIVSFIAVIICLIIMASLFYSVPPPFLVKLALAIGVITGICITLLIHNLLNVIKNNRLRNKE
jgi:uncharacterized membrane protein YagU involved in acid resistance